MTHHAWAFDEAAYQKTLYTPLLDNEIEFADAEKTLRSLYEASADIGLGSDFSATRTALAEAFPEGVAFLTGAEVPGFSGWYTQSAATVAKNLPLLEDAANNDALNHERILRAATMLRAAQGKGLLVKLG
ncbi:MAG: hypothetical protein QM758_00310 [Armatimonas sp.]